LRSTSRFGFAGVTNALHLEQSLLRLYQVTLVLSSWRERCCIAIRGTPLLHCAWLVVRVGVLCCILVGGDTRTPFSAALALTAALGFLVRVSVLCVLAFHV
jgi:hypothetical protein